MPRRLSSPFSSNTPSPLPAQVPSNEKANTLPRSKSTRIAQFFSTAPRSKNESQTAHAALLAAATAQQQLLLNSPSAAPISSASLSLPTISLSTATADNSNMDEPPTTLFKPLSQTEARKLAKQHAQFGPLGSPSHRYSSSFRGTDFPDAVIDDPPYFYLFTTYLSFLVLIVFGHIRDFFGKIFRARNYKHLKEQNGYAPLHDDFDNFYIRRLKTRINDCFARPTTGVPGRYVTLLDRKTNDYGVSFQLTGTTTETLNLSSYNYLGFAQSEGPCADAAEESVRKYGISYTSSRADAGTSELHTECEELIADFVGKPAAMVFSMGFVTNSMAFQALVGKGCLVISDELNHASIRFGVRLSGAIINMCKHNDMQDLGRLLRKVIAQGQPRTHRPWKKILVVVEGLYSMEGTMCNLPDLLKLKRRYKFNLFIDEAHSIGALGPKGRGVCDYFGVDTSEVDILMGTLTKSFGANGGYIAGDKAVIDKLRVTNAATLYGESPTVPVIAQIVSSLRVIKGEIAPGQGEERLQRLAFNSRYLRLGLKRLGFITYGHDDSPIIPVLLYNPAKMPAFSHEMLKRKIAVVIVSYPATPLATGRARFCVSAAHNKDDLDRVLAACDEIGSVLQIKFSSGVAGGAEPLPEGITLEMEKEQRRRAQRGEIVLKPPRWHLEDVIRRGVQDVKVPLR
ncbi:MAG: serine palmitoyltransferase component [Cirrosporium novae-zelandiae]|nr:MAG: serine palmitoyltransferase component [Cirrosporium novae-zelandiae]